MATTAFDSDHLRDAYPPGIERSWWHRARNRVIARAFARYVPRDARVLEVGCGTGIVTTCLRGAGWNVEGVDPAGPIATSGNQDHLHFGINAADLPAEQRASFQVLALFDVIEHVADAPTFLRELLNAFPNVQLVLVTVPARRELWSSFDDHYGHFKRYDRHMLRDEFTRAGLVTERADYFFHALYPVIALNNALRGRKRDIRFKAPAPGPASSVHQLISCAFSFEARVLPASWVGSSIIGVARRP